MSSGLRKPDADGKALRVLVGSMLALLVCNGPILVFTFGLFLKPVSQELGWDRGTISAANGIAIFLIAITAPLTGAFLDRWGVRRVLLTTIPLFAASVAAISLTRASPVVFIALYAFAGLAASGQGPQPYVKVVAEWFDDRRGLALGVAMSGAGLGIIVVPQIARFLIEAYGWRNAYVGLGAIAFALAFPAVALFVREPAAVAAQRTRSDVSRAIQPNISVRALLRSRRFWLLSTPLFLVATAVNGTLLHLVPLLTDRGMSTSFATSLLSTAGLASIVGRMLCGYLSDRLFAPHVAAAFFLLPCTGICLLIALGPPILPLLAALSLGLALGCEVDMLGLLTTRYFGLERLAQIYGYLFAVFAAGTALGPYVMGVGFDVFHTYNPMLVVFGVALSLAGLLISRLGSYDYPARVASADAVLSHLES